MKQLLTALIMVSVAFIIGIIYCYYSFPFWTHLKTENFEALTEYNGQNITGLYGRQILINKKFTPYIIEIDNYAQKNNIKLIVNQSYRFNKKTINRAVVNPASVSNHLAGFAIDFNIEYNGVKYFSNNLKRKNIKKLPQNIQNFISAVRKHKNLRWGGDFNIEDPVHIDYPLNLLNKEDWITQNELCHKDFSQGIPKWKIWKNK
ncbi:hypothetical protein C7N43_30490 [Sphingobacteriales bacterium UPWRP_1]|nr:hypothetical protein BVG80_15905 [Sphingobacteriales bacterium TSM_CSM]PSJ73164.1 hypothetical protein C7N43_30490 [Sphingobacteriales bacterium UPWRP_1]